MGNARNIAFWVVLFLLVLALFNLFSGGQNAGSTPGVSYSDFVQQVDEGKIASVSIDGEKITVVAKDNTRYTTIQPDGQEVNTSLLDKLIAQGVEVEAKSQVNRVFCPLHRSGCRSLC